MNPNETIEALLKTSNPFELALEAGRMLRDLSVPSRVHNELRTRLLAALKPDVLMDVQSTFDMVAGEILDTLKNKSQWTKDTPKAIKLLREDLEAVRHAVAAVWAESIPDVSEEVDAALLEMNLTCEAVDQQV